MLSLINTMVYKKSENDCSYYTLGCSFSSVRFIWSILCCWQPLVTSNYWDRIPFQADGTRIDIQPRRVKIRYEDLVDDGLVGQSQIKNKYAK